MTALCECGCGQPAPLASKHSPSRNLRVGDPQRFILGHSQRGRTHTLESRQKMSATRTGMRWSPAKRVSMAAAVRRGADSPVWKGDDITYSSMHSWLGRKFAKTGACSVCGERRKTQWANLSGEYRRDVSDFAEMCGPCHLRYDWSRKLGVEQLREALRYARDCIASPDRPFSDGKDIYDTVMMMKALRQADAALAIEDSA